MPGNSSALGFGNCATQRHLPGARVDGDVGEQQVPVFGVGGSVLEGEVNHGLIRRGLLEPALGELALELIGLGHRLREVGIDGIELLDRRQMRRLVLADEGAFGHQRASDPSGDRGANGRVIEVELGARDGGLLRRDLGIGLAPRRDGNVVLRF